MTTVDDRRPRRALGTWAGAFPAVWCGFLLVSRHREDTGRRARSRKAPRRFWRHAVSIARHEFERRRRWSHSFPLAVNRRMSPRIGWHVVIFSGIFLGVVASGDSQLSPGRRRSARPPPRAGLLVARTGPSVAAGATGEEVPARAPWGGAGCGARARDGADGRGRRGGRPVRRVVHPRRSAPSDRVRSTLATFL